MVEARPCPACGHVNTVAAEACASCGEPLPGADVHPGETFRDPDDLSFPEPAPKADERPGRGKDAKRAVAVDLERARTARGRLEAARGGVATGTMAALDAVASARGDGTTTSDDAEAQELRELAERIAERRAASRALARQPHAPGERPAHYAGFVIRLVAFAIDVVVLIACTVPLTIAALYGIKMGLAASGADVDLVQTEETWSRLIAVAWLAMAVIYFTALHSRTGQTIGKATVGIAVRRARDLAGIGVFRSLARVVGYALSSAGFFLGFLTIILGPRKRGWHDYLAGTCVVHLAPEEA